MVFVTMPVSIFGILARNIVGKASNYLVVSGVFCNFAEVKERFL
jgi:hypothetical protein